MNQTRPWLAQVLLCAAVVALPFAALAQSGPPAPASGGAASAKSKAPAAQARRGSKSAAPAAEAKADAASARQQVDAGIAAFQGGKNDVAVASFTSALSTGTLASTDTARALYYRGLAYRKLAKPALAIADLTSALWLKDALDSKQRADAQDNRAAAYREAGLPEQSGGAPAPVSGSSAGSGGAAVTGAAGAASSWSARTSAAGSIAPGTGGAVIERVPDAGADYGTIPATADVSRRASSPPSVAAAEAPAASSGTGSGAGGLGSFFGDLFGGGKPAAPAAPAAGTPPATVAHPWSSGTVVGRGSQAEPAGRIVTGSLPPLPTSSTPPATAISASTAMMAPAAAPSPAPLPRSSAVGAGSPYLLQVAAVRSNDEALGVAAKVQERYARELGSGRGTSIDETVLGNMGTMYRVKVGPFAANSDPRALCDRLKSDGLDCLIVPQ